MITLNIRDLSAEFRTSAFFQTLDLDLENESTAENNTISVPENCTRIDPIIIDTNDLAHRLRTIIFWGFEQTPVAVWDAYDTYITNYGDTPGLRAKLCALVPDMDLFALGFDDINPDISQIIKSGGILLLEHIIRVKRIPLTTTLLMATIAADTHTLAYFTYLHDLGCPVDACIVECAASCGHVACLRYMHERYPELGWTTYSTYVAATRGHLECVKYLHAHGCPWSKYVIPYVEFNGHTECAQYMIANNIGSDDSFDE